jgi:hypothetical protein
MFKSIKINFPYSNLVKASTLKKKWFYKQNTHDIMFYHWIFYVCLNRNELFFFKLVNFIRDVKFNVTYLAI